MKKGFRGGIGGVTGSVSRRGKFFTARLVGLLAGLTAMAAAQSADAQASEEKTTQRLVAQEQGSRPPGRKQNARADAAEALFRQAQQLGREGKWSLACEKFAASSALEPGVGTLLYLGDCYERLGHFASASKVFSQAAELAGKRGDKDRQHVAAVRAAALEPRAPRLEVRASDKALVPGLQVTFNGIPMSHDDFNAPQPRDAGEYGVEVSAPGYESFKSRIELRNGASRTAVLTIPQLVAQQQVQVTEPGVTSSRSSSPSTVADGSSVFLEQSTVGLIVGGAGIVLAGASGLLATFARGASDDSQEFCVNPDDPNLCSPRGVELRDEAFDMATLATIAGVASGLALAGGTYLYITAEGTKSGKPEAATLHVAASFDWF